MRRNLGGFQKQRAAPTESQVGLLSTVSVSLGVDPFPEPPGRALSRQHLTFP